MSIHRLTKDLNRTLTFYPSYCAFQDQGTERWLDFLGKIMDFTILKNLVGKLELRIIYLFHLFLSFLLPIKTRFGFIIFILDIHHLVFLKLCFLPHLKENNIEHFHCGICGLENHKYASFSLNNEETSTPFALIHGDFLGPSTIPNVSGACFIFTYWWLYQCVMDFSHKK